MGLESVCIGYDIDQCSRTSRQTDQCFHVLCYILVPRWYHKGLTLQPNGEVHISQTCMCCWNCTTIQTTRWQHTTSGRCPGRPIQTSWPIQLSLIHHSHLTAGTMLYGSLSPNCLNKQLDLNCQKTQSFSLSDSVHCSPAVSYELPEPMSYWFFFKLLIIAVVIDYCIHCFITAVESLVYLLPLESIVLN